MTRIHSLLAGVSLVGVLTAQTLVVPSAAAAADGNSSSSWPFDVAAARLLYIYDSSHFSGNGVNFPILINQISWRANGATATWAGSTFPATLDLSTAPIDFLNIDATFDNNHGADRAQVFNGSVTIAAGSQTTGTPGPFHVTMTLNTPFLYDPAQGDLVIDTIHSGHTPANSPTMDAVTTAGVANARRVSSISATPAAAGSIWTGELANVLEVVYTPAAGLYAGFQADTTSGPSPLAVNFTDASFSSAPGGVTTWAWDFENDGIVDSNLQNPSHVYTNCGAYDVSLTVNDGVNPPSTMLRTAYITTDAITADFDSQVIGVLAVQFTDTSDMPATSWAWDLDGDGLVDTNQQNPGWVYPSTAPVAVTLTVTRLCSAPSVITKTIVPAQQLSTNLTANNGLSAGATNYFDVDVLNPTGIDISSFDIVSTTLNTAFTVDVYLKPTTYLGSELTPADWTLVGTASGTSNATGGQPSSAVLAAPVYLPQGTYGMALRYNGVSLRYVTGASTYANGDLALTLGASAATYSAPFTTTSAPIANRSWCGTIYYGTHNITGLASYGFFAPGCAGTLGVTNLSGNAPQLGGTLDVDMNNLPFDAALMVTGESNTFSAFGPLPIDLTPLGMPGCSGNVSLDFSTFVVGASNAATWSLSIPNTATLSGLQLYNQAFVLDLAANGFGFVTSDAAAMILGN